MTRRGGRRFPRSRRILRVCPEARVNGALTRAILATIARAKPAFAALYELANDSARDATGTALDGKAQTTQRNTDNEEEKRAFAAWRGAVSQDRLSAIEDDEGGCRHFWPTRGGNKTALPGVGEPAISGYRARSLRVYYWPCNYC